MQIYFPDVPELPLPPGHRFPAGKYTALLNTVSALAGNAAGVDKHMQAHDKLGDKHMQARQSGRLVLVPSPVIDRKQLLLAHSAAYVDAVLAGTVPPLIERRIGLPWSPTLRDRSLATVGGSLAAARTAMRDGVSGQLAGGTHHAHRDGGSGFCVFNDLATVCLVLLAERALSRIAIIDLDVHHGDGNALILRDNMAVFTLSMHGEKNFPFVKPPSTLDIGLADHTGDAEYLDRLDRALAAVFRAEPELVLYIAGADPLESDRLGRLSISHQGLGQRDRMVLEACRQRGCPIAIVTGGGYAEPITDTVAAYAQTFAIARDVFAK